MAWRRAQGGKRQRESAMSLSTHPAVLRLDEPLAGMGSEETDRMLNLLDSLKSQHAILLVEHDMDAVFRISDEITVMVNGAVIAHGAPATINADPLAHTAYLGADESACSPQPPGSDRKRGEEGKGG